MSIVSLNVLVVGTFALILAQSNGYDKLDQEEPLNVGVSVKTVHRLGQKFPNLEFRIKNNSDQSLSVVIRAPWEMAQLSVTRDGVKVKREKVPHHGLVCGHTVPLAVGQETLVQCTQRVSSTNWVSLRSWALSDFGYDVNTPGHYVIRSGLCFLVWLSPTQSVGICREAPVIELQNPTEASMRHFRKTDGSMGPSIF